MRTVALVVAAGRGERAAQAGKGPKQYALLRGRSVLARTLACFADHADIDAIQVVIHPDDSKLYSNSIRLQCDKLLAPVFGGETRQLSVLAGLDAISETEFDIVLIHDAARPLLRSGDIDKVLAALKGTDGAILAVPVADTLKRSDEASGNDENSGHIVETISRAGLWRALTPQGFRFSSILDAHRKAALIAQADFTDDASVAEAAGLEVALVVGHSDNIKITTVEDFDLAERLLGAAMPDVRVGNGFDVHRFAEGDVVWLCGIEVPHTHRLDGHSDADVGLHALTDAILGTLGDGDIGHHFPPTDPKWKGAASDQFLAHAVQLVHAAGGRITHMDVTLLCEAPKIGPHRTAMRSRIADIAGIEVGRVAVKATTTERLGFTGRREGIAAMATATVVMPPQQD